MIKIDIYSEGPCALSVCADKEISVKEITELVNEARPTNIQTDWEHSNAKHFKCGVFPNPGQCPESSDRLHYLFNC